MGARGWAGVLLSWRWDGVLLTAEVARVRYFVRGERHEVIAWAEARDLGGRRRVEIGSFRSVGDARGACERDAERRVRREEGERGPVSVAISPGRRRVRGGLEASSKPAARDPGEALDAALAAFMPATEERG
jgi:hypothetical protein